jgi:hypothetical protein
MGTFIQILALIIAGIILLWVGYTIFLSPLSPFYKKRILQKNSKKNAQGTPGEPQVCPVCLTKLYKGELVKSVAFPSISGGRDRLMHIRGCVTCLKTEEEQIGQNIQSSKILRKCPICKSNLSMDDFLISRMFERVGRNNHVHVLGCNTCRPVG